MRLSVRNVAAASLSSLALVAASGISALAAPDPDNHGHHYGQLKHHPVTSPPPVPVPTPHPVVQPNVAPAVHPSQAGNINAVPVQQLPLFAPPAAISSPVAPVIQLNRAVDSAGQYDWLLLLILPSLLAVWLIALIGLARRVSGARKKALQMQPAPA